MDHGRVPATSGDVSFPAYVAATTGAATWALNRWVFHTGMPPEIYIWVQLTIPVALGRLAAGWRVRVAERRRAPFEGV
jgi:predicted lysophospholipase L1 biosynthesis ABC-type transport system permease subunit